jgi:flagellar P-ring protein FlgI
MRQCARRFQRFLVLFFLILFSTAYYAHADGETHKVLIRDVATVEGVRENSLVGYGLVVGLKGTGDKQQTYFTVQTLASILARMGVEIPATVLQSTVQVKNVAAVFVTATLPPFAPPGMHLDVMVSSVGDARSLEGGLLLLTPLYAADGQVYAAAQGPLVVGGYAAGTGANSKTVNHPTVGRVPSGGIIERDSSLDLTKLPHLSLILNEADFSTAQHVAAVINHEFSPNSTTSQEAAPSSTASASGTFPSTTPNTSVTTVPATATPIATAIDSRRIEIQLPSSVSTHSTTSSSSSPALSFDTSSASLVPALLARIENLEIEVRRRAKVVVNERTGTVVLGKDVRLGAVSILHGTFSIEVTTAYAVSQPNPLTAGKTQVVPETKVTAGEAPARNIELGEGASVEQLVTRLQAIGATARDVVSILQAIKAAGALEAELEVI